MTESISTWLERLKTRDEIAAHQLWQSYSAKLVRLARQQLRGMNRSFADEEDVALSAFDSFCRGAGDARFAQLDDRNDLWKLLVVITLRKANDLHEYHTRQKRSAAMTLSLPADGSDAGTAPVSREPPPDLVLEMAEEVQRLLAMLDSNELQRVALWKMEGYSNGEIATLLGCAERTVERKIWIIKQCWEPEDRGDG